MRAAPGRHVRLRAKAWKLVLGPLATVALVVGVRAHTLRELGGREQCYLVEVRAATADGSLFGAVVERKGPSERGCEIRFPRPGGRYVLVFDYGEGNPPEGKWPRDRPYVPELDDPPGPFRSRDGQGPRKGEGEATAALGADPWP